MTNQPNNDFIINVSINRFARDGFDAPLRTIAEDAGVSAALLIKKFGSKDNLRKKCDEIVLLRIRGVKENSIRTADAGDFLSTLASSSEHAPLLGYTLQSVLTGGEMGKAFIEQGIEDATEYMSDAVERGVAHASRNERARARYLFLSGVGAFVLSMLLDPSEDTSDLPKLTRRVQKDISPAMMEVFVNGVFTDRNMLDDYLQYIELMPETPENQ